MERMRKIKRQLSLTLGRGGAGGGDRMLSDTINQEVTSHSDSGKIHAVYQFRVCILQRTRPLRPSKASPSVL